MIPGPDKMSKIHPHHHPGGDDTMDASFDSTQARDDDEEMDKVRSHRSKNGESNNIIASFDVARHASGNIKSSRQGFAGSSGKLARVHPHRSGNNGFMDASFDATRTQRLHSSLGRRNGSQKRMAISEFDSSGDSQIGFHSAHFGRKGGHEKKESSRVPTHTVDEDNAHLVMDQESKKRRSRRKMMLAFYAFVDFADLMYGLFVFFTFMEDVTEEQMFYRNLYIITTTLGVLATAQLLGARFKAIQQINEELSGATKKYSESYQARVMILRNDDLDSESPEFRLGEEIRIVKGIRAIIWCAFFEDFLDIVLLIYRIFVFQNEDVAADGKLVVDVVDALALLIGGLVFGFKIAYYREYVRAKRNIEDLTTRLVSDAKRCSSILDGFENVSTEEVNKVVAVRTMLGEEIRRFPAHVSGDVKILRMLRFCKGNINKTVKAMRHIFLYRAERGCNDIAKKIFQDDYSYAQAVLGNGTVTLVDVTEAGDYVLYIKLAEILALRNESIDNLSFFGAEFAHILQDYLSVQQNQLIESINVVDATGLAFNLFYKIKDVAKESEVIYAGLGARAHMRRSYFIRCNSTSVRVFDLAQKLFPSQPFLQNTTFLGHDLTSLYQEYPAMKRFLENSDQVSEWFNKRISDLPHKSLFCTLLSYDVGHFELLDMYYLEKACPAAFEYFGPMKILRYYLNCGSNISKTEEVVLDDFSWAQNEPVGTLRANLIRQGHSFIENPSPTVLKLRNLMGVDVLDVHASTNFLTVIVRARKIDVSMIQNGFDIETTRTAWMENMELAFLYMDNKALELGSMVYMDQIIDCRGFTTQHKALTGHLKAMLQCETHYPPARRISKLYFYGLDSKLIPIYYGIIRTLFHHQRELVPVSDTEQGQQIIRREFGAHVLNLLTKQ